MPLLVDYSHQAYILSCNDTDYSFFGSQNYQQTSVHVEEIAGHNRINHRNFAHRSNTQTWRKYF